MGFNQRSRLYGATRGRKTTQLICDVSIHAPTIRSDQTIKQRAQSMWVSIHAPPIRSDSPVHMYPATGKSFNPRSAYTERRKQTWTTARYRLFQSTLRLYGATKKVLAACKIVKVSIHAPPIRSDMGTTTPPHMR